MNPGDLLDRIEDAAITGDVEQALLLCQKLAGNADSSDLRDWAQQELKATAGMPSPRTTGWRSRHSRYRPKGIS